MTRVAEPTSTRPGGPEKAALLAVRRHRLTAVLARALPRRCDVPSGAGLVVGVSGGADSVALLLGCAALRDRRIGIQPIAVHVHHHLRESAAADADSVSDLCRRFDIEWRIEHVYPAKLAGNVSDNARRLRYDALAHVARSVGAAHVAVAHHAEDQLETVLMALGRGAGLDGLSGMAWRRSLTDDVSLVRPFLATRRSECESLCRAAAVEWREDPTNGDATRVRGRLRRDVLPVLQELWPDCAARIAGTTESVDAARQVVEHHLQASFGDPGQRSWSRDDLRSAPVSIIAAGLRRAVAHGIGRNSDDLGRRQLLRAAEAIVSTDTHPREFHWPHGLVVHITSDLVTLDRAPAGERSGSDHAGIQEEDETSV